MAATKITDEALICILPAILLNKLVDDLPAEEVWNFWSDGMLDVEGKDRLVQKLKDRKVPVDLVKRLDLDHITRGQNIYLIQWPRNMVRLIFKNLWEKAKELEAIPHWTKRYQIGLAKELWELAVAVDQADFDGTSQLAAEVRRYINDLRRRKPVLVEAEG